MDPHLRQTLEALEDDAYVDDDLGDDFFGTGTPDCLPRGWAAQEWWRAQTGRRKPNAFPRNPILRDGRLDNQNHAIISHLQLIDANQDNHLEEYLKIRNIFAECEYSMTTSAWERQFPREILLLIVLCTLA